VLTESRQLPKANMLDWLASSCAQTRQLVNVLETKACNVEMMVCSLVSLDCTLGWLE
jgi:hypothetical protein